MRKLFFTAVLTAFAISAVKAQVITKRVPVTKNTTIRTIPSQPAPSPAPPPPPASTQQPVTKQAPAASDLIYSLTSVKANIRTGNDNKEYPSSVRTTLGVRGSQMEYSYFVQENLKNEMKSNSNTEFGLEKATGNFKDITLDALQNAGIQIRIAYSANFQLDAWKIEGVSVTLEFRDQYGNLHPTLAQKTITFNNANGFLNGYNGTTTMICTADGYLNPLSAYIN